MITHGSLNGGQQAFTDTTWVFRIIMKTGIPRVIQVNLIIVSCMELENENIPVQNFHYGNTEAVSNN